MLELPEPGVYAGLDWIRCTGPEALIDRLLGEMRDFAGIEGKECHGAKHFKNGASFEPGVMVSWGHKNRVCQVDVQGQRLRLIDGPARVEVLRQLLEMGMKARRLDLAVDFVDQQRAMHRQAVASCQAGELCGLRSYEVKDRIQANGQALSRHLALGARESPVCARIYDKGLEQGYAVEGYWERVEVEFKKDRAEAVADALVKDAQRSAQTLVSFVFGAFEFRTKTGRGEMARRPLSPWWADLLEGVAAARTSPAGDPASFRSWLAWLQTAALPRMLQCAEAARITPGELMEWFCQGLVPRTDDSPIVQEFVAWFATGSGEVR
ncbi:MAG: replication initiation factor domain-containing protein [Planctomycetota bacterium]